MSKSKNGPAFLSSIYNFVQARSPTVFIDLCETRKALIAGIILRPLKISVVWTCSDPGLDRSVCVELSAIAITHIDTFCPCAHFSTTQAPLSVINVLYHRVGIARRCRELEPRPERLSHQAVLIISLLIILHILISSITESNS